MAHIADKARGIIEIVAKYAELVEKEMRVNKVYLFGSYVSGTFTEDSDIDVAIVGDDFTGDPVEDMLKLMKIRRKVDKRIEPHPFKTIDFVLTNPLVQEIVETGIQIQGRQ
ncbi:MAG: nucleotidyltransferase domain-containing protein [Tepidanaerobacteraceae bacterium]|jgi:predicted nucleotidyltransferase|nr:nucleotidyltransferase domain-containing protein [Tepidanaerobacteraceae bacterium]